MLADMPTHRDEPWTQDARAASLRAVTASQPRTARHSSFALRSWLESAGLVAGTVGIAMLLTRAGVL